MEKTISKENSIPVGKYVLYPGDFTSSPCEMCGKCCNNDWIVSMDAEDFNRYKTILENSDFPDEYSSYLQEEKDSGGNSSYKLVPCRGRCIFLMSDNKCYIHGKLGPEAKSRTCKNYPLSVSGFSPRGMHLKMSFICPSILNSLLSPDHIQTTKTEWENDFLCPGTVRFSGEHFISWDSYFSLTDALSGLFLQKPYHAEHNLIMAGILTFNFFDGLKQNRPNVFNPQSVKEYMSDNKKAFLETGYEFIPQYKEQMNVISFIAYALMEDEFIKLIKGERASDIVRLLDPEAITSYYSGKIQETYNQYYINELPKFSHIIEKYLLHKILDTGIFTRNGFVYGINYLSLCYSFFRLYLLAGTIFGKNKLDTNDVLEAISFVELKFTHKRSMEGLKSSRVANILSSPALSLLLLRL